MALSDEEIQALDNSSPSVNDRLRLSIDKASKRNPDSYAEYLKLSKRQQLPVDTVERNIGEVKQRQTVIDNLQSIKPHVNDWLSEGDKANQDVVENLKSNYPHLSEWLSDEDNASVAIDDLSVLKGMEDAIWRRKQPWYQLRPEKIRENFGSTLGESLKQMVYSTKLELADIKYSLKDFRFLKREIEQPEIVQDVLKQIGALDPNHETDFYAPYTDEEKLHIQSIIDKIKESDKKIAELTPNDLSLLERGIRSGTESTIQNLPGLVLNMLTKSPKPMLALMGGQTFIQAYGKGRAGGMLPYEAFKYGGEQGTIEVLTELLPTKALTNIMTNMGFTGTTKEFAKYVITEIGGEQVATLTQSLSDYYHGLDQQLEAAKTFEEKLDIMAQREAITLFASLAGTATQGSIASIANMMVTKAATKNIENSINSMNDQQVLDNIITYSQESKTNGRAQEQFQAFLKAIGPDEAIYVPADVAERIPNPPKYILDQLNDNGVDIEIPLDKFSSEIVPNEEIMSIIRPFMKMNPNRLSSQELQDKENVDIKAVMEKAKRAKDIRTEADKIYEQVKEQIVSTGRQSQSTARLSAQIIPAYAASKAERLGLTPKQVYEAMGLSVVGPGTKITEGGQQILDQGIQERLFAPITENFVKEQGYEKAIQSDGSIEVYHGTSKKNANAIRKSGEFKGFPFFALDKETAEKFARQTGKNFEIMKVRIDPDVVIPTSGYLSARIEGLKLGESGVYQVPNISAEQYNQSTNNLPETISIDGVDRPTTDSTGKLIAQTEEGIRNFYKWFGDSKVVDDRGRPLVVYHGTTHNIESFTSDRGNPENDLGIGYYFTNSQNDASVNYAGEGPDLTNRIENRAEQIDTEDEIGMDAAREQARKELSGDQPNVTPVYLSFKNPVILGGDNQTYLGGIDYNEDTGEETGPGVELYDAIQWLAIDFENVDPQKIWEDIGNYAIEELPASEIINKIKESEGTIYITDDNGNLASGEFVRQILAYLNYDSIIDNTVAEKFGVNRKVGRKMEGVNKYTSHYVAFEPTQIKSAIGNVGTFDPTDPRILYQTIYHGSPYHFDKFTLDHIGKGEGAQAYGWGLYFAESKGVAQFYKDKLSDSEGFAVNIDGKIYKYNSKERGTPEADAVSRIQDTKQIYKLRNFNKLLEVSIENAERQLGGPLDKALPGRLEKEIKVLKSWVGKNGKAYVDKGSLYKVELTPKEDEYLLWDKPLSEQSEKNKSIIKEVISYVNKKSQKQRGSKIIDIKDADGRDLYRALSQMSFDADKGASQYLNSLGIKGIKYLDAKSRDEGKGSYNYVIFDENAIQILETLYQGRRGSITLLNNERIIELTEASDLSTFLHESGHLFLEMEKQFASQYGVTEDQQTILDWLGVESFDQINTPQHEQFAEGFEAYLREGKAPSLKLRDAFAAFRRWLTRIYQSIRQLNATLTPEITEVFDRLLATQAEIDQAIANPMYDQFFRSQEQAGMTDAEWEAYQRQHQRVKDRAETTLDDKLLAELRKRKTQEWNEERAPLIEEEMERLANLPIYKILSDSKQYPMDRAIVKEIMGFDTIPPQLRGMTVKDGVDPHEYAEYHGFNTIEAMVQSMMDTPKLKDAAKEAAQQRMIDKYGDTLNDGTIEEEAKEALHNEEEAKLLLQELRALGRKTNRQQEVNRDYLKAEAKATISGMTYREIKPDKFYRAEIRAAKKAITAKTDSEKYQAKLQQIANHYLYREAVDTRDAMQKQRKYIRRVQTREYSTSQVNPEYVQNMKTLAGLYDLKSQPDQVQALSSILNFYETQINDPNQYVEISLLDPHLVLALEAKGRGELIKFQLPKFEDLNASDLRGMYDMIRHLRYVGGQMSDVANAEMQAQRNSFTESIIENGGKDYPITRGIPTKHGHTRYQVSHFLNKLPSLRNMMRKLDNDYSKFGKGIGYDLIYREIENANNKKIQLEHEMNERFKAELNDVHRIGLSRKMTEHLLEDGTVLSLGTEHKFMIGAYWGTETSREAIRDAFGVTDSDVIKILSTLTEEQLNTINALWKVNETVWPELSAASVELYGVAPPKLDPTPFTVNGIEMTGGHMRLFYDSTELELKSEQEKGKRMVSIMPTKAGSLHARVGSGGRPPALDINNITRAINDNIHFVAFAESGKRLRQIVNSKDVKAAIERKHGSGFYRAMIEDIDGITSNRTEHETISALASMFRLLRHAAIFKHLAYNVRNTVQQFSAIPIATDEVGVAPWTGAFARFIAPATHKDFVEFVNNRSSFMNDRARFVNREATEILKNITAEGDVQYIWEQFKRLGFTPQTFIDSLVSYPTWMAKYEQAMTEHGDDKLAISQADTAVAESVGSGSNLHIGGMFMSNNSEFVRTFTIFGTWFNSYYQRIYRSTHGFTHFNDIEVMRTVLTTPLIVATLAAVLVLDVPEDDEEWWKWLARQYASFMGGTVPLLRDVVSSFQGFEPKTVYVPAATGPYDFVREVLSYGQGKESGLKFTSDITKIGTRYVPIPGIGNVTRFMDYVDSYNQGKEGEWSTYQSLVEGPNRNK